MTEAAIRLLRYVTGMPGRMHVFLDSPHPLDIIDRLPKLPIDYGSNQVFFTFKEDPETVTVRAYIFIFF